ncbi:MAG: sugar phosphate isomerase/epimerase family protein [Anaerolineae bacterium]
MANAIPIGMCVSPDKVPALAKGYDFLELAVSSTLMPLEDDDAFAQSRPLLAALRPPIYAFNVFIAPQVKLVGPDVNIAQVTQYIQRALKRVHELNGQVVVFGSGGARMIPDGFNRAIAWGQLVRFLELCSNEALKYGIKIAIEPLNRGETNVINSYREGVQLARDVGRDEVRVLADIYHFMLENEPLDDIADEPDWLAHVHLADTARKYPGSGMYPLERLFSILHDIEYSGKVSVECSWGADFTDESARALHFLRPLAEL